MKTRTVDQCRIFRCKRCGKDVWEDIERYYSKPQKQRKICIDCIEKSKIKKINRAEEIANMNFLRMMTNHSMLKNLE